MATARAGITSMTGFAETRGEYQGVRWQWEVKTVNGRALDIRLRLPPGAEGLESEVRRLTQSHFARGSVQIGLELSRDCGTTRIVLNEAVLADVAEALGRIRAVTGAAPPTADGVAAIRGVLEVTEPLDDDATRSARQAAQLASFATTLEAVAASRAAEGERLAVTLHDQLDRIDLLVAQAEHAPARQPERIAQRLKEHIERLFQASNQLDPQRLHQEAMLLATRADISEELQRLRSHIAAARQHLASGEPVGRKLDFLAQEFNREANTLCTKASDAELTRIGLALKALIDQWREQVQNVE